MSIRCSSAARFFSTFKGVRTRQKAKGLAFDVSGELEGVVAAGTATSRRFLLQEGKGGRVSVNTVSTILKTNLFCWG